MTNVVLRHVNKGFGRVEAVCDLSLAINNGEFVVLLGPSGAGKTTTLRLISGLERPDNGSIAINGRDVTRDPPGTRDIAFVFQQYSLYPHLTVYDNLAFPLRSPIGTGSTATNGRDVTRDPPGTRDIAFVFQQYSLYPHLTVYDNLAFPLRS